MAAPEPTGLKENANPYVSGRDPYTNRDYHGNSFPEMLGGGAFPPSSGFTVAEERLPYFQQAGAMGTSGWHIAEDNRPLPSSSYPPPLPSHPHQMIALSERMGAMELARRAPTKDLVVQVIEAAESVLRDQASALRQMEEENERLHSTLKKREWELQNHEIEATPTNGHLHDGYQQASQSSPLVGNLPSDGRYTSSQGSDQQQETSKRDLWAGDSLPSDAQTSIISHSTLQPGSEDNGQEDHGKQPTNGYSGVHNFPVPSVNGSVKNSNLSDGGNNYQFPSQSRGPMPLRSRRDSNPDMRMQLGGQALPPLLPEMNPFNGLYNQEMVPRFSRAHEEIGQLRNLVQDAAIKEMQLIQDKSILEKRISDLHATVDQYENQLVEAASKAVMFRQNVLEENARLTTRLRAAEDDLSMYAKSLLPLLVEYNLQPAVADAYSIATGIKALVQHLQGLANFNEGNMKTSSHPKQHWNPSSPQVIHGHEIVSVPQYSYPPSERPVSPMPPLHQNLKDWEADGMISQYNDPLPDSGNDLVRRSPYLNPGSEAQDGRSTPKGDYDSAMVNMSESMYNVEDNIGSSLRPERPERADHGARSPKLPTVLEESGLSGSEDDDPLPAIEGLCINGDVVLGSKLGASGYSINGTSLCHFQWVRHYRDGTFKYIPGAAQPDYTITADDIGTRISVECTPMDDRNRKGKMVSVFANDQNWIALDEDIEEVITEHITKGQAFFQIQFWMDEFSESEYQDGTLMLKQSGYEVKRASNRKVVVHEKYTEELNIELASEGDNYALAKIHSSQGNVFQLIFEDDGVRDEVVLTMRRFIKGALDHRRAKKSSWLSK